MKLFVIAALFIVKVVAPNSWDDVLTGLDVLDDQDLLDLSNLGFPEDLDEFDFSPTSPSSQGSIDWGQPEPLEIEPLFSSNDRYVVGGQIRCPGELPPQSLFPPGISRGSYKNSLHFLCALDGGAHKFAPDGSVVTRNAGCRCANPGVSSEVICMPPPLSHAPIYNSDLLISCELLCECAAKPPTILGRRFPGSPKVAETFSESFYAFRRADGLIIALFKASDGSISTHTLVGSNYGGVSHAHLKMNPAPGRKIRPKPVRQQRLSPYRRPVLGIGGSRSNLLVGPPRGRPDRNCPARCDGYQCGSSCKCSVAQVGPQLWSPGHCISLLSGKRKKRDLDVVCACNATYVSGGCCSSVDGIVHETPEQWMGRLDL